MKKSRISLLLSFALILCVLIGCALVSRADETYVDLTTLKPTKSTVGWGSLCVNQGLDGKPIDMAKTGGGTQVFEHGFTAHAKSSLDFDISGLSGVTMFTACIGAEHATSNAATSSTSIRFLVYADGVKLYESGVFGYNDPYEEIFVSIPTGTKTLTLVTDDVGSNTGDHSAWGSPRLLTDASVLENFKEIVLSTDKNVYLTGSKVQLNASFYNLGGKTFTPERVAYTSGDPTVAEISSSGLVTSKKEGLVRLTVTATHRGVTLEKTIAVTFMDEAPQRDFTVSSPNGFLKMDLTLDDQGMLSFTVGDRDGVTALERSYIGLNTEYCDFSNALRFLSQSERKEVNETYTSISGKKSSVNNHYIETAFFFRKDVYNFDVIVRMYDDGFAYRFRLHREDGKEETLSVLSETGTFAIPAKSSVNAEFISTLTSSFCYEEGYSTKTIESLGNPPYVCMPANISIAKDGQKTGKYLLLSEADYFGNGYAGSVFKSLGQNTLGLQFAPKITSTSVVTIASDFSSPWRYGIYGDLKTIVESCMTENLAPAPEGDFSWVEPGVTAWMWLSEGYQGQRTESTIKEYVDMAAEMGWKYLILDEGWQPNSSKAGKAYEGYFRYFESLVKYAAEKGVGFIAWVKYIDLDTPQEREILTEWANIGIKGIKADFFDSEDPATLAGFQAIYEKCAENHLIVNCHGASKPTGERRTWPNVINREAVNGEEYGGLWMNGATYWAFARNVVGPVDITPRLYGTSSAGTTTTAQMACNVVFEAGIPCMASDSEDYLNFSANSFYKNLPAAWDDICYIDGAVGSWVSLARRSGETWFAATMSNGAKKDVQMPLDFLGEGKYVALKYTDATRTDVQIEAQIVTSEDTLTYSVSDKGGFVVKFIPANSSGKFLPSAIEAPESLTVYLGFRETIPYTLTGENIQVPDVLFRSSDPSVVSVNDQGVLTGVKAGSATITVTSIADESIAATISVKVADTPVRLADSFVIVNEGDDASYKPSFYLNDSTRIKIVSNPGNAEKGTLKNELCYTLPKGDFTFTVVIADCPNVNGVSAGVILRTNDHYALCERVNTGSARMRFASDQATDSDLADNRAWKPLSGMYVQVTRSGDQLKMAQGFSLKGLMNKLTVTVDPEEECTVSLYSSSEDKSGVFFETEFRDFTVNGTVLDFTVGTVDPSADPSVDPSRVPEEPSQSENVDPSASSEESKESGPSDDQNRKSNAITIVLIAVGCALLIGASVAIAILTKKKKKV